MRVRLNGRPRVVYQKCDNFIRPLYATIVQRYQSGLFHYAFEPSFELVAARFCASVEASELASHWTNREQTSYELKVKESMRILVETFVS